MQILFATGVAEQSFATAYEPRTTWSIFSVFEAPLRSEATVVLIVFLTNPLKLAIVIVARIPTTIVTIKISTIVNPRRLSFTVLLYKIYNVRVSVKVWTDKKDRPYVRYITYTNILFV